MLKKSDPKEVLNKVCGIIFDCDGVLVDSLAANDFFYNYVKEYFGCEALTADESEYVHRTHVTDALAHILPADKLEEALKFKDNFDYSRALPYLTAMPQVHECIAILKEKKKLLAINTSRGDSLEIVLKHVTLFGNFNPMMTTCNVANPKPAADGIFAILEDWKCTAQDVLYIGDSYTDELTAKNSGVHFWSFNNDKLDANYNLRDYTEFIALLSAE